MKVLLRLWPILALLTLTPLLAACQAGASPAASRPKPQATQAPTQGGAGYVNVRPAELAGMLKSKDFLLVNVHVPYEGELEGTDLFLPYDQVEANLAKLPADKGAKIVLYCRSGSMSTTAAQLLVKLGYTNVRNLEGGMIAWKQAGFTVQEKAR